MDKRGSRSCTHTAAANVVPRSRGTITPSRNQLRGNLLYGNRRELFIFTTSTVVAGPAHADVLRDAAALWTRGSLSELQGTVALLDAASVLKEAQVSGTC
jgi:hypothetical protein